MARRSKEFLRRSAAAKQGWKTRRRHEREARREAKREFERRSAASRKGWATRKEREREEREPWRLGPGGILRKDWIVEEPIEEVGGRFTDRHGKLPYGKKKK